jgi:hypothetical protein
MIAASPEFQAAVHAPARLSLIPAIDEANAAAREAALEPIPF